MMKKPLCATKARLLPSKYKERFLPKGPMLPRFPLVCLAFALCAGVCAGPQPDASPSPSVPQNAAVANAGASDPHASGDALITGGLNSLQGVKVALIQVSSPGVEHPESLLPLLAQKANEPLDKRKVRQSVQMLYNTGRFAEIEVE